MTVDEAFSRLGLDPGADAKAIKRAYHTQLRQTKPDRDPEGFRRLREAFEVASGFLAISSFRTGVRAPEAAPDAPSSEVDPNVVHAALDRGELQWAHTLVMDARWADAMLDEPDGPLGRTTRQVGLAVILVHRPAFDALASKYPSVFPSDDRQLAYLLWISAEWTRANASGQLPPEFAALIQSLTEDEAIHRQRVRALGQWFHRDVPGAMEVLDDLLIRCPEFAWLLDDVADAFSAELDAELPHNVVSPAHALRPLLRTVTLTATASAVALFMFGGGTVARFVAPALLFAFFHYAEHELYMGLKDLRCRFLAACIEAGLEPRLAALGLRGHPLLRSAIRDDGGLPLAFRIGRLAALKDRS